MSGDILLMARNGTTLLPGESKKLALAYDTLASHLSDVHKELGGTGTMPTLEVAQRVMDRLAAYELVVEAAEVFTRYMDGDPNVPWGTTGGTVMDHLAAQVRALRDARETGENA